MRVFVTGASGHIASAVIPELVAAGHEVTGLARSDAAAAAVTALGATPRRGDLDDLENLRESAAAADGVIHLAFKHEQMRSGAMNAAVTAELAVVGALGGALAGSGKPLVIASGTLGVAGLGRPATEADPGAGGGRMDAENAVIALAGQGVRSSVVRIAPVTHGELDQHGFAHVLIGIARQSGVAGYPGDGTSRWPAGHTLDVGHCFCLALEKAPAGTRWHPAGDEGIPQRDIALSIGRHLGLPVESIPADKVAAHFSFLGGFIGLDNPVSTAVTREVLGWEPTHPGLLEDFDNGTYFPE
jgi:nucleoside-diphosphate-sugar epimerase